MSTTFEEALRDINSRDNMRLKLMSIKTIGHHAPLNNLASFTTVKLKELGLVTSVFSRNIQLHSPYDRTYGVPAFFTILMRYVRQRLPYLSAEEVKKFIRVDRYSMTIVVEDTPTIRRYLNRYISSLRSGTNDVLDITLSELPGIGGYRVMINMGRANLQSYKVLRYIQQIVDALFTLHRHILLDDPITNANTVPDDF